MSEIVNYKWWIICTFVIVLVYRFNQLNEDMFNKHINRLEHHVESLNLELMKVNQKCDSLIYHIHNLEDKN
jgi:hypothetical protein